jgi:hypothetical protein
MKHIHDGLDGGIPDFSDDGLLVPNGSLLGAVQTGAGTPAPAAQTVPNNGPASGAATNTPGIGKIWYVSDDGATAPTLPAAVEANAPVQAAVIPSGTTVSAVQANADGSVTESVSFSGSNISFNNTFAAGVPQAYINCALAAEQTIASQWGSPNAVTLNEAFTAQTEGQNGELASNGFHVVGVSYTALVNALNALKSLEPGNAFLQQAVAHLPGSDPTGGAGFALALPYARMLGLTTTTDSPDDTVILNTSYNWSYGQDVINTLMHEISEGGMGRIGGLGDQNHFWSIMDLFRYNASIAPDYTDGRDGQTTYFSYNGGASLSSLAYNNEYSGPTKVNSGDTADFTQLDVFGTGSPGETNTLSATDLQIMEALGWSGQGGAVNIEARGDFNTDGQRDAIWRDSSASMTMWSYDATGQAVNAVSLGQVGFSWSIVGSGSYIGASTSQMLVASTDGTMALWSVSGDALTGVNLGKYWTGIGYIDTGDFTSNGLDDMLVFNQSDHHLYDWWVSGNQLTGLDLGAYWNNIGYVAKGQFTSNGSTNFLVTNTADHHLYDWWISSGGQLQGIDLGAHWSNIAMVATGQFMANGGTNLLVTNTADQHLYDWWISSNGQLQGIDLGAHWSNISLIAVGNFDSNTTNTEFLVQNTADHHVYEWWINPQGILTGIDLGQHWANIQLVDSGHFNNQSANNELLVRNTADGHFYEWWISGNQLQGADLGTSASASSSGQTASAAPASAAAPQPVPAAPAPADPAGAAAPQPAQAAPTSAASTGGPAGLLAGNPASDNFTFADQFHSQNQAGGNSALSEILQQLQNNLSPHESSATQLFAHQIGADPVISPDANDGSALKSLLLHASDFHFLT